MATMWCSESDVANRLKGVSGKGWNSSDVESRIIRAMNYIKMNLANVYSASIISGWDSSCPGSVKDLTANMAAMILKSDYDIEYKPNDIEKSATLDLIKRLQTGSAELLDSDGNFISYKGSKIKSNTYGETRDFTKYHPDHTNHGFGSLDGLGPETTSDDNYPGGNS